MLRKIDLLSQEYSSGSSLVGDEEKESDDNGWNMKKLMREKNRQSWMPNQNKMLSFAQPHSSLEGIKTNHHNVQVIDVRQEDIDRDARLSKLYMS